MTQQARHRLHTTETLAEGAEITLSPAHSHYLANVLRLKPDDAVRLFNADQGEWRADLSEVRKKAVSVSVAEQLRAPAPEPGPILAFAPIKKARMDFLVEKAVELGASVLQPVFTHRTQGQKLNYERMGAQVIEAAEQSERLTVPQVRRSVRFDEFIADPPKLILFADEARDGATIQSVLAQTGVALNETAVFIGPEGGFAPEERDAVRALAEARAVSLGSRILRAETAALAALAQLPIID